MNRKIGSGHDGRIAGAHHCQAHVAETLFRAEADNHLTVGIKPHTVHFEVFGSRSEVLQEPNNQKEIFERIFNEEREKFESKYEDWELEAGLFDPDDFNEYREQASFRANSEIIDKVIELNNINPGLKQILLEREIGSDNLI